MVALVTRQGYYGRLGYKARLYRSPGNHCLVSSVKLNFDESI